MNYNLLITTGGENEVDVKLRHEAHIWVHNKIIMKKHMKESEFTDLYFLLNENFKSTPSFDAIFNEIVEINKIDPADHSKRLSKLFEEAGELAKEINKVTGRKILSAEDTDEAIKQNICDEAADTIQNVISLVEAFGITPQDIINSIFKGNKKWIKNVEKRRVQNV